MQSKTGSILSMIILAVVSVIFVGIGSRFLFDPVGAAAARGIALDSGVAVTTVRVGMGVFPLGIAAVTASGLVSRRFRRAGLRYLSGLFAIALVVRIFSVFADHADGNGRLIVVEAVILALSILALLIEKNATESPRESFPKAS